MGTATASVLDEQSAAAAAAAATRAGRRDPSRSPTPPTPIGSHGCSPRSGRRTRTSRSSPPRSSARSPTSTATGRWRSPARRSSAPPSASSATTDSARYLHSYIAGVKERLRGSNVGFALKQHQRAWALGHGLTRVTWTFDPLVRRNAYFNLVKLGAAAVAFHRDFYGAMQDGVNAGDMSDRILIEWNLDSPRAVEASALRARPLDPAALARQRSVVRLRVGADGAPEVHVERGAVELVQIPEDIVALRSSRPRAGRPVAPRPPGDARRGARGGRPRRRDHPRRLVRRPPTTCRLTPPTCPLVVPGHQGDRSSSSPSTRSSTGDRTTVAARKHETPPTTPAPSARSSPTWARRSCPWCPLLAGSTSRSACPTLFDELDASSVQPRRRRARHRRRRPAPGGGRLRRGGGGVRSGRRRPQARPRPRSRADRRIDEDRGRPAVGTAGDRLGSAVHPAARRRRGGGAGRGARRRRADGRSVRPGQRHRRDGRRGRHDRGPAVLRPRLLERRPAHRRGPARGHPRPACTRALPPPAARRRGVPPAADHRRRRHLRRPGGGACSRAWPSGSAPAASCSVRSGWPTATDPLGRSTPRPRCRKRRGWLPCTSSAHRSSWDLERRQRGELVRGTARRRRPARRRRRCSGLDAEHRRHRRRAAHRRPRRIRRWIVGRRSSPGSSGSPASSPSTSSRSSVTSPR